MKIGQTIQCQACGASSVIKHHEKSLLECQYCGAMMTFSEQSSHVPNSQDHRKPTKIALLLIILPIIVIILMVVFWLAFQDIRNQSSTASYAGNQTEIKTELGNETQDKTTLTPLAPQVNNPTQANPSEHNIPINQNLKIESQVSGITSNGGKYWLFSVKNTGEVPLARPGVMVSLFNKAGQRVAEQGGWSLKEVLPAGEQATVLVFLNKVPENATEQQVNSLASKPSKLGLKQVAINVKDYNISTKNKRYEIIGDVINKHTSSVKFTRVVAVAYNAAKKPIGIGNAFSTVMDLAPNQSSGFKVSIGTFLTEAPVSWQLWAVARAQ